MAMLSSTPKHIVVPHLVAAAVSTFCVHKGHSGLICTGNIWYHCNHHQDTRMIKASQYWYREHCRHIWVTAGQSRQTASAQLHFIFTACQMQSYAVSLTEPSLNTCHLWGALAVPDLTPLLLTLHKSFESFSVWMCWYRLQPELL